jgi:RNA polymerase sigma-70 factor, ECF subfamily
MRAIKRWLSKQDENAILNADAFAHLYEETHLSVFRYVYGLSGGPLQEAEDITAETYTRAWRTRQHFRGDQKAALGWLLRIARNLVIDLARRRRVRDMDENIAVELLVHPDLSPEMDVAMREQIGVLWEMLHALPDDVREMLVLRYIVGCQVKQIAALLDMNENTVTVTIKRTLKRFQRDWPQLQESDHE